MELRNLLDQYHLARIMGRRDEQLDVANLLVDSYIPELIEQCKALHDPLGH